MNIPTISDAEFIARKQRAAELTAKAGYDVLLVNSTEADYANVRYFCDYWPIFEIAGVAIAPAGEACALIGLESEAYAQDRSKNTEHSHAGGIPRIRRSAISRYGSLQL